MSLKKFSKINLIIGFVLFIAAIIFDRLYMADQHEEELSKIKKLWESTEFLEIPFYIISNIFYYAAFLVAFIFYFYSSDKKRAVLY